MKYLKFVVFFVGLIGTISNAQHIIPEPEYSKENGQQFSLQSTTKIYFVDGLKLQAELLQSAISPATGWDLSLSLTAKNNIKKGVFLKLDSNADVSEEGYLLNVTKKSITITGKNDTGVFYGIQSLLQLLPVEIYNKEKQKSVNWFIQGIEVKDNPQYAWRGMMLDVSRYFFGKEYVLKFIDMMAMYKLNILHLHLIDDAGWRLEIKKYPKLTSVGAWRGEGANRSGGYYTQEDVKEIVAYATMRNVDVIPEIELPAHTLAAISAYPHLSCRNENIAVPAHHFISRDLYCVGKESTFEFLEDVFTEVFSLFPSKYIHIGGDEARYDRWKACPHCQKRKKELGITKERNLQVYFNQRIQKYVQKSGKILVGWDEIIEDGLTEKAVGMIWHKKEKTFAATKAGHDVVMALTDHCYFDVAESKIPGEVKAATWLAPISLERVYKFNPMIKGLDSKYRPQVLGGHACLWSDQFIHGTILQEIAPLNENRSEKYIDYLTFPRMAALAEALWSPLNKQSWEGFEKKMSTHYNIYDEAEYGYRVPQPKLISKNKKNGKYVVELENVVEGSQIRYSINGVPANAYSTIYNQPVAVENLIDFEAITVVNRSQYSLPLSFPRSYKAYKKHGKLLMEWDSKTFNLNKTTQLEINATGKINKNKSYEVSFIQIDGKSNLEIVAVAVFKNGKKITENKLSHVISKGNNGVVKFDIVGYETGAAFKIKVKVKSGSDVKTYGAIFIK